jgi:heme a synthase
MVESDKAAPFELWYIRLARISVGAVLFLILVGGIVRSTGSGMGCPDWPKCFGRLVPPTKVEDIPRSFFEIHPQFESKTFNAAQTWTEYLNRLVGAVFGLLMLVTALLSVAFFRKNRRITLLSFLALLLTGFEGWLGKLVVDKNLEGGMVTLHMLGALVIVAFLIVSNYLAAPQHPKALHAGGSQKLVWLGLAVVLLTLGQILVGTQVRESVDVAAQQLGPRGRDGWLQPSLFYSIHKTAWMLLAAGAAFWVRGVSAELGSNRSVRLTGIGIMASMGLEICFGLVLAMFDLPPVVQPLHMLFANLIFALAFSMWMQVMGVGRMTKKGISGQLVLESSAWIDAK